LFSSGNFTILFWTKLRRGWRASAWSHICSAGGPGLAEGMLRPAWRHPALLPTGLLWGLHSVAGHENPMEKIWVCLWGGRRLKCWRMEDYHVSWTLDRRGLQEVTGARNTSHQLTEARGMCTVTDSSGGTHFRLHNCAPNASSTQQAFLSRRLQTEAAD